MIEPLESRIAPAVTASFVGGVLTITGDDAGNALTIAETATPGAYTVAGLDAGQPTDFTGVTAIIVKLLGGDDTLVFNGDSAADTGLEKKLKISSTGQLAATLNANVNIAGLIAVNHTGTQNLLVTFQGAGATAGGISVKDGGAAASLAF